MWWQQLFLKQFVFPSFSYIHETHSYRQSLLEGPSNCQSTHLSYIRCIRGDIPPRIIFHSFLNYEILTGDPLTTICLSLDLSIVSGEAQNPIYDLGPLPLQYFLTKKIIQGKCFFQNMSRILCTHSGGSEKFFYSQLSTDLNYTKSYKQRT